eukprot:553386-Pyramimonas_sp.AAC.1
MICALCLLADTPDPDARLSPGTTKSSFSPPRSEAPQHSQCFAPGSFTTVHLPHVLLPRVCPWLPPLTLNPPARVGDSSPVKSYTSAPAAAWEVACVKGCLPLSLNLGPGRSHISHLTTSSDAFSNVHCGQAQTMIPVFR